MMLLLHGLNISLTFTVKNCVALIHSDFLIRHSTSHLCDSIHNKNLNQTITYMKSHGLSKSRLTAWRQCPRRLWLQIHQSELSEVSHEDEQRFQIGYEVGDVAQQLYPGGILINDDNLGDAIISTQKALNDHQDRPLFEATFQHEGLLVRCDMLIPTALGFRMVEVKSSTKVKPYHVDDCAIQAWVLQQNGISTCSVELAHIDSGFVYQGDGNYHGLFHHAKLDNEIEPLLEQVPQWIASARSVLASSEPDILPGAQCDDPFECSFKTHCHKHIASEPEPEYPLSVFYRMSGQMIETLRAQGHTDARTVPEEHLNSTQRWIQRVSQTGQAELDAAAARIIAAYPYPRYYLDFETIALAVPRWEQTSPYRTQVPFQWSCHIEESTGALQHAMFLDVTGEDPRRACAESLVTTLGTSGPIFVYYQAFEKGRISELAERFPDMSPKLLAINQRIIDLLPIARAHYYHPAMKGSWSMKAVLPTIASDVSYGELDVSDGMAAQDAYREILHTDTPVERRQQLTAGLRDYCALDTLAMVRLAHFLMGKTHE